MTRPLETDLDLDSATGFRHQGRMNLTFQSWRFVAMLVCAAAASTAASADGKAATACPADPVMETWHLPRLRDALAARTEGLIVALGSSSTQGVMASDSAHTYPAILQAALNAALPRAHIAVINRGISGEDAAEHLARLESDVFAVRPQLVIWQVGANGVMAHADPVVFHYMVADGVGRLRNAGIDVILMDNQRSPRVLAAANHVVLEDSLRAVGRETNVNLFSRGRLMDAWSDAGAKPGMFIASDGLHHNDLGYECITHALARQIVAALNAPAPVAASK
jgi:acyl-CoA thioesterase I